MNRTADLSLEDFRRLPGLYRRWELTEVCEPNRNYQIEDAGAHADGTPLLDLHRFCSGHVLMLGGPLFEGHW